MTMARHRIRRSCGISQACITITFILCAITFLIINYYTFKIPLPASEQGINTAISTDSYDNTNASYVRKPFRQYVFFDIEIDGKDIGRITAELYTDIVPKTTENFRALMTGELGPEMAYKGSVCHRILKGFIVQCGDYTLGTGYGGRSIYGGSFDDEPNGLRLKHSKRYILQMANAGPNTNGSQFCIMLGPAPHLNGKHVVFGEIVDGFEVVDKMETAGVDNDGMMLNHVVKIKNGGEV